MFIVLLDEPGLFVFASPAAAVQSIEPPDAESGIRAAFDHVGVPYRVAWTRPNQHSALFGNVGSVQFGEYQFVKAGQPDIAALIALLEEHSEAANPPESRDELRDLLKKLRVAAPVFDSDGSPGKTALS
jgi:hypothetical protein